MVLEPKKDPSKQVHNVDFMITNVDVAAIIQEWLDEWHDPLAEPLPEDENEEDPPVDQGNGQGNKGNDDVEIIYQFYEKLC